MGEFQTVLSRREALRDPSSLDIDSESEDSTDGQMKRCII